MTPFGFSFFFSETQLITFIEWNLPHITHIPCLEYIRVIGDYPKTIEAVDPSGGPFLSLSDELKGKYKIINILNPTTFLISERDNNN